MPQGPRTAGGLCIHGPVGPDHQLVLTAPGLEFVAALVREFAARRDVLLAERERRQARFDAGERPGFLPETRSLRETDAAVTRRPVAWLKARAKGCAWSCASCRSS